MIWKHRGPLKLFRADIYAVGSPKRITVYVQANDYNQAIKMIQSKPEFIRWGNRPKNTKK